MDTGDLKKKKQQALKALEKYTKLREEVFNNCHCPKEDLVPQERYNEGGYDYTAYTKYWDECTICGRRHNEETKNHGWYG